MRLWFVLFLFGLTRQSRLSGQIQTVFLQTRQSSNDRHLSPFIGQAVAVITTQESDTSSDCALVLQRTFQTPALIYNGFFKILSTVAKRPSIQNETKKVTQICIRYLDVNRAFEQAKLKRSYVRSNDLNSPNLSLTTIDQTSELTLQVTRILAFQFQLSSDEILKGLSLIDLSRTNVWSECPAFFKPLPCTMERFRTYTGVCNNLKHPTWGATYTPFVRNLSPMYADGISSPRVSVVDGSLLPNPRLITMTCHQDFDNPDTFLTIMTMSWGQLIDHDITLAASPKDGYDNDCCDPSKAKNDNCMPIEIPSNDPFYSRFGNRCNDFKRTMAGHRPGCSLGPRVQINTLTSVIDANFVYGSTEQTAKRLRAFQGGQMRVWNRFAQYGLKPLLPPESENPEQDCNSRPRHLFCFIAGDERVNEQIHLTVLHTLYVRDHNRIASELNQLNAHWDDERIYQETRHIMAAAVQHITLNEFLPMILGQEMILKYNLTAVADGGYWNGYDDEVHPGPANSFQSAAFRFGHTFIQGSVRRYNKHHEYLGSELLRNLLRHPFIVYEPGKLDELIGGMINTPAQTYDPFITQEVSNHLFQKQNMPYGLDLPAMNLMRGRETGVPGYNFFREWCGFGRARTFEQLAPLIRNHTIVHYSRIYKHPDDIDLWSGGISEQRLPGAMIGPTFACIVAHQFSNIRKGDRFWYENPGFPSSFTLGQLYEIRRITQAKIVCENADDIPTIQMWVMKQFHPITNPRFNCKDLPSIDLRFWQENPRTRVWKHMENVQH